MALTRAEIELLIKARSEADQTFQKLSGYIKQVTGDAGAASQGMAGLGTKTQETGTRAIATGVAFGLLAERLGRGLVSAFQSTIQAANQLDSGLIGLRSVANAFKQDAGGAEAAAKSLAADGLLSVGQAASALKNLLAAGFGLPEAITLVNRFKDSAAFGRQSSLDFGAAVTSATEGIKNGNSILVDNAGVTKNLSQILVEAGFSAQDLSKASSDVNIRMALFNGIVEETNPQLGDAARYLDTAAGKQAQFSAQVEIAQQKIGKALQPALASALETLVPFVKVVGDAAPVLAPLGLAVAGVVLPLTAFRSAAALGVIDMASFTAGYARMATVLKADAFASLAAGLRGFPALATSAASSVAAIPGLIAAAPWAAGAAAIGLVTVGLVKLYEARQNAALQAQVDGAKQDVINRAFAAGAPMVLSYAGAIDYNTAVQRAHQTVTEGNTQALRQKLDAQLKIGEITRAQYADEIRAVDAEERRQAGLRNAPALRQAVADAEANYQREVRNTGLSLGELQTALRNNETAFTTWAATAGLSDTTIARLKDSLKEKAKGLKESEDAARKAEAAQKALRDALEQTAGVLTQRGLNEQLGHLEELLQAAAGQGSVALRTAVVNLAGRFQELRQKAIESGLAVDALDASFNRAAASANLVVTPGFEQGMTRGIDLLLETSGGIQQVDFAAIQARINADQLSAAYQAFGLRTPGELQRVAAEAQRNYQTLLASGTATTQQLSTAYDQMIQAQQAATGRLPSFWQTEVFPAISQTLGQLNTAMQGTFAQMLLGAKGFKDGFTDIWESIKSSVTKILADLLGTFVNSFLKGIIGALSGQQGAFSQAFSGFLGGGGGGGLPGLPGPGGGGGLLGNLLGGLLGRGGPPLNSQAIAQAGLGLPPGGGGFLGGLGGGLLGGAGAAAAGYGLGRLGQNMFGGAGWGAGTFGAGSGAATGALIGSVVPGLGTAVGAIIGGLAGALSGAIGQSQGMKTNDVRDRFFAQFGGAGTGEGSGFHTVAAQLAQLSEAQGGGFGGGRLFQDLIKANTLQELQRAITAVVAGLQQVEEQAGAAGAATAEAGEAGSAGFAASRQEVERLEAKARDLATQIEQVGAAGGDTTELNKAMEQLQRDIALAEEESRRLAGSVDRTIDTDDGVATLSRGFYDLWRGIERAEGAASNLSRTLRDMPSAPTGDGGSRVEGGAAGGVYATRPGLVLFGEGGQPEVGGPRSFFKDVFAELGVGTRGAVASGGGATVVPFAMFFEGPGGFDFRAINQHLASSAGITSNDFGLREIIEGLALNVVRREMARRG